MKFKTFLTAHKGLVRDVVTSTCLLGASAGIVFGVSAATFKVQYMDLNDSNNRFMSYQSNSYESERINSEFNMNRGVWSETIPRPTQQMKTFNDWLAWHPGASDYPYKKDRQIQMEIIDKTTEEEIPEGEPISDDAKSERKDFTSLVIDGAAHTTMDRSFNQQLFEGLADFNNNQMLTSYDPDSVNSSKPSQDNTTEFINIYNAVMQKHMVIGLAGFNHATPMNSMMTHVNNSPYASCSSSDADKLAKRTSFILLDANIADNQNVASVQFRADQPGFLTALAVCDYFYHNLHIYHDHYQNISVGALGGIPIPTVMIYMGGFERGIELFNYEILNQQILEKGAIWWLNPDQQEGVFKDFEKYGKTFERLAEYSKYKAELEDIRAQSMTAEEKLGYFLENYKEKVYDEYSIKIIRLGEAQNHFSGTFASGDAIGLTKQFLNRGASALIVVAGPQSLDAAQEIKNQNSKCVVIGVDTAMEDGDYQRFHDGCSDKNRTEPNYNDPYVDTTVADDGSVPSTANGVIKFSAVKDIKSVSRKMTRLIAQGMNWDVDKEVNNAHIPDPERSICGPGFQTCGNIKNGLVSISWDGFYYLFDALQHLPYGGETQEPFANSWKTAVNLYRQMIGEDEWDALGVDYTGDDTIQNPGIYDYKKLETFNRYNSDGSYSPFFTNYTITTSIVAKLLETSIFYADRTITLWPNDPDDLSKGFRQIEEGEESKRVDVMTWLDYNMYFTC